MAEIVLDERHEAVRRRLPRPSRRWTSTIGDGEFMILVGPSGCGKSTALRMIAGLEDISDGELRIGGDVVNEYAPKDRDIAMVFQNYALYPHMTVRENMAFPLKLARVAETRRSTEKVEEAARILDLERAPRPQAGEPLRRPAPARRDGPGDRPRPAGLPDGRAALEPRREAARADAHRGRAAPEATSSTTTVYVTHDQTEAMTLGDRVAVMRDGVLQQVGSAAASSTTARQPVRRRLHRLAGDELHAGDARRRHREAAVRRRPRCPRSRAAARATHRAAT